MRGKGGGGEVARGLDQLSDGRHVLGAHPVHQPFLPADLGGGPGARVLDGLKMDRVHQMLQYAAQFLIAANIDLIASKL